MNSGINYTVIIPHKNTPELLRRCLASIPQREDIQIIVVDDNSDSGVNFETFPGLGSPRVEVVFAKEGKGAGYARNIGLKKSVGKWVLFADADDFFIENFLEHLDKYKDSSCDLVYFGTNKISQKTEGKNKDEQRYDKLVINNQDYEAYIYTAYVPWGKMIRLSLIQESGVLFDETKVANDKMFSIKIGHYASNIHFNEHKIYTFVQNQGSLTQIKTIEANFERFFVYVRIRKFLREISKEKYRINLIPALINIINIHNMDYFRKSLKIMIKNDISIFMEAFEFCTSLLKKHRR